MEPTSVPLLGMLLESGQKVAKLLGPLCKSRSQFVRAPQVFCPQGTDLHRSTQGAYGQRGRQDICSQRESERPWGSDSSGAVSLLERPPEESCCKQEAWRWAVSTAEQQADLEAGGVEHETGLGTSNSLRYHHLLPSVQKKQARVCLELCWQKSQEPPWSLRSRDYLASFTEGKWEGLDREQGDIYIYKHSLYIWNCIYIYIYKLGVYICIYIYNDLASLCFTYINTCICTYYMQYTMYNIQHISYILCTYIKCRQARSEEGQSFFWCCNYGHLDVFKKWFSDLH